MPTLPSSPHLQRCLHRVDGHDEHPPARGHKRGCRSLESDRETRVRQQSQGGYISCSVSKPEKETFVSFEQEA